MEDSTEYMWSTEKSIELAQALEIYSCLWDRSHAGYKKKNQRFSAVKSIAETMNLPFPIVDSKIRSIIGQFQRELKKEGKIKTGTHAGERYKSKWFLYNHLKFLERITSIRPTIDSSTSLEDVIINVQEHEVLTAPNDDSNVSYEMGIFSEEPTFDRSGHDPVADDETEHALATRPLQSDENKPRFSSTYLKRKAEDNAIIEAVNKISASLAEDVKETDEWDAFGAIVAKKMRLFKSDIMRLSVENEIHNILFKRLIEESGATIHTQEVSNM